MAVTGGAQVQANYARLVGRMTGPRTKDAVAKVLSIGMTGAKQNAPMEYGTLINSAFRRIDGSRLSWTGTAGFMSGVSDEGFNYALFLHETTNWSPLRPSKKKGPAWNSDATSKYLEKGFTDSSQLALMSIAIGSEYRL